MKLSPGEGTANGRQLGTLEAYLQRGGYEKLDDSHSSYDTICERLIATDPSSIVAIDGPSNGGKTSLTKALVGFYESQGIPVSFIPLDYFLTDRATRNGINQAISAGSLAIADYSEAGWEQARYRETLLLAKQLSEHGSEPSVLSIPNAYDRRTGTKEGTESVIVQPGSIIVTEGVGIQAYHSEFLDYKIRVDASDNDILLRRVLERERQKPEGTSRLTDDFLQMRYGIVDAPHTDYLRMNTPSADFVVDTSNFSEMQLYKHR
jgi:uridine kinase